MREKGGGLPPPPCYVPGFNFLFKIREGVYVVFNWYLYIYSFLFFLFLLFFTFSRARGVGFLCLFSYLWKCTLLKIPIALEYLQVYNHDKGCAWSEVPKRNTCTLCIFYFHLNATVLYALQNYLYLRECGLR